MRSHTPPFGSHYTHVHRHMHTRTHTNTQMRHVCNPNDVAPFLIYLNILRNILGRNSALAIAAMVNGFMMSTSKTWNWNGTLSRIRKR